MLTAIKLANVSLRFVLELCVLVALGYWGFQVGRSVPLKTLLGIGAPLLAAVVWGVFVAPKASVPVPDPLHLVLELVVFGAATVALYVAGRHSLAWVLGIVFVINRILMYAWGQ